MKAHHHLIDISSYDETELFSSLSHLPYFIYLDSADATRDEAPFSYMGFNPFIHLSMTKEGVRQQTQHETTIIKKDPFDVIQQYMTQFSCDSTLDVAPFWGGAVGYFSYEMASKLQDFKLKSPEVPLFQLGFYNQIIAIDKKTQKKWWIQTQFEGVDTAFETSIETLFKVSKENPKLSLSKPQSNLSYDAYHHMIHKAKTYIAQGDIYQVNLSHRFESQFEGDPTALYQRWRTISPAPYSAYLSYPDLTLCSASPEQFFRIDKQSIQTRPIKGTAARFESAEKDDQSRQSLVASKKDHAELLMITDLLRNDLAKVCDPGSVRVSSLKTLEAYPQVFHLVSTIQGYLSQKVSHIDAFMALFPGGSITGAPKIRATELIDTFEPLARNVYTGCIGYFGFNQKSEFNIAIRCIYIKDNKLFYHVGSGIVADSEAKLEWEETLAKAANLFQLEAELCEGKTNAIPSLY